MPSQTTLSALGVTAPAPSIWDAVDELVDRAPGLGDLRAHGLHLLAAARWRSLGRSVPRQFVEEERKATLQSLAVPVVLERIRAACEGPLILMKGYEVACRYPDPSLRPFNDIDVLAPEPSLVSRALVAAGFEPVGHSDEYYDDLHHLRPLCLPSLAIVVEIHRRPEWVRWSRPPSIDELVDSAIPSRSGVEGILTLSSAQHALVIAAHSWAAAPLRRIMDLVDAAVLAAEVSSVEVDEWARRWDIEGLWRFMSQMHETLLWGSPPPRLVRTWGRSTLQVREATVFEQHERRLLGAFSVLPLRRALREAGAEVLRDLTPAKGETWAMKMTRTRLALRNAFIARSRHDADVLKLRQPRR
jgi:hypothetical protein